MNNFNFFNKEGCNTQSIAIWIPYIETRILDCEIWYFQSTMICLVTSKNTTKLVDNVKEYNKFNSNCKKLDEICTNKVKK